MNYTKKQLDRQEKIITQALEILESRVAYCASNTSFSASMDTRRYLRAKMRHLENEQFKVLFLTAQHKLIADETLFTGTIDGAAVYPREVVKAALKHNACAVIFAHNHPSGEATPSHADRSMTKTLIQACSLIDVRVLDHIIVGANNDYSFAENGIL